MMFGKILTAWTRSARFALTALLTRLGGGNLIVWIHLAATRNRPCGLPAGCGFALLCVVLLVRRFGTRIGYTNPG